MNTNLQRLQEIEEQRLQLERRLYLGSFSEFFQAAWKIIFRRKLVWGWHLELLCWVLEQVFYKRFKRVIINVPPRSLKSTIVSVMYNAWVWAHDSSHQFLSVSHEKALATRDSRYTRNLIQSDWYHRLFPHVVIVSDQNAKMYYETDAMGHRNAVSIKEGITGKGGDTVTIDDPHDARRAVSSDKDRESVYEAYEEGIEFRLNDPAESAIILMMQRLHDMDLTGWLLKNRPYDNWHHVCLPLEYEPDHPHKYVKDIRKVAGECLIESRWPKPTRDKMKAKPLQWAGQLQQRPTVRGGLIFLRKSWNVWTERDIPEIRYVVMSLDTAYKDEEENDFNACTMWGLFEREGSERNEGRIEDMDAMLLHAWKVRARYPQVRERIQVEYTKWVQRKMTPDIILIEDKASGQSLIQEWDDAGIPGVTPWPPRAKGSGVRANEPAIFRAHLASDILDDGAIWIPGRAMQVSDENPKGKRSSTVLVPWAEMVVAECEVYPKGEHDDLVTTCVQAWRFFRMGGMIKSSADVITLANQVDVNQPLGRDGAVYG